MTTRETTAELARGWIEAWTRMDLDRVRVEDGVISEIRSFYDTARIREILSPDDRKSLGGTV